MFQDREKSSQDKKGLRELKRNSKFSEISELDEIIAALENIKHRKVPGATMKWLCLFVSKMLSAISLPRDSINLKVITVPSQVNLYINLGTTDSWIFLATHTIF